MSDPLLAPLAAIAGGILAARFLNFEAREAAAALAALAVLSLICRARSNRRLAAVCALAASLFLGVWTAAVHRRGSPPEIDAAPGETVILEGCVVEPPVFFEDRGQFTLELEPATRARVTLRLAEGERPPHLDYGLLAEVDARVAAPRNFLTPGSFDYAGYLERKQIYWTATVSRPSAVRILPGTCGNWFDRNVAALRGAALNRIVHLYPRDSYGEAMMKAILVGDNSHLEKAWTEAYRKTGTFHAIVISGLHLTVLAGLLLFLLRVLAVNELLALLVTAAAAWLYALVAGWQAPVVRAAGGFSLYLAARYFYRRTRVLNLLAAVAIAFLLADPEQLFEPSFQLSFLAVAAIGGLAAPLVEASSAPLVRGLSGLADVDRDLHLEPRVAQFRVELRLLGETASVWSRIPLKWCLAAFVPLLRWLFWTFEMLVVSTAVQIGLALPLVVYFHRLSVSGLTANLVIVPVMAVVVPAGFLGVTTGWTFPALVARTLLEWSRAIVEWHSGLEPPWRIPPPPLWLAVAYVVALCLAGWCLAARVARSRQRVVGGAAAVVVLGLLALIVWHPFPPELQPESLELTMLDVGQSESLFLALPDGKTMLVDGGGFPSWGKRKPRLDIGEDVVSPYLWSRSIRKLNVVALSHAHADHIGGLPALLENFRPAELWAAPSAAGAEWTALQAKARALNVKIVFLAAGQKFSLGGAGFEIWAPPGEQTPSAEAHNNDSLVIRVRYGERSFLLTGDIENSVESRLVGDGLVERSDVLKVAHHGSRTSSLPEFLQRIRPSFALISAGYGNVYRNPHREVLERLASIHAAVYRTDLRGAISVRTDGKRLEIATAREHPSGAGIYSPF